MLRPILVIAAVTGLNVSAEAQTNRRVGAYDAINKHLPKDVDGDIVCLTHRESGKTYCRSAQFWRSYAAKHASHSAKK